jgi:hypothetical protein
MLEMLFFYDGPLSDIATTSMETEDLIDAKDGYSKNMEAIRKIIKDDKVHMVVSNQIKLLDNMLLWDKKSHRPKLCLLDKSDGKWKPAGRFTRKDIKNVHNLERMYIIGEFAERAYKTVAEKKPRKLIGVHM